MTDLSCYFDNDLDLLRYKISENEICHVYDIDISENYFSDTTITVFPLGVPKSVISKILLKLKYVRGVEGFEIEKHKQFDLTMEHKGKRVSLEWVLGFLNENSSEAKETSKKYNPNLPPGTKYINTYVPRCISCGRWLRGGACPKC